MQRKWLLTVCLAAAACGGLDLPSPTDMGACDGSGCTNAKTPVVLGKADGPLSAAACANPLVVAFAPEATNGVGGMRGTVVVDMTTRGNDVALPCVGPGTNTKDVLFRVDLPTAMELDVHLVEVPNVTQSYNFAIAPAPCAGAPLVACEPGAVFGMRNGRLEAGTYYVSYDTVDASFAPMQTFVFDLRPTQAPPANDDCATAEPLVFTNGVASATGDTTYAANSNAGTAGSPSCGPDSIFYKDVVYTFTLSQAQDVQIVTGRAMTNGYALDVPTVALQKGACGPGAAEVACTAAKIDQPRGDTTTLIARNVQPGTYYVWVDGSTWGSAGPFELHATLSTPTLGPPNESCAAPATLVPNAAPVTVDLGGATGDFDRTLCGINDALGGDAVYQFTLAQAQYVTVKAESSEIYQPYLEVRSATCGTGAVVACQYEPLGNSLNRNLAAGTYFVTVKQRGYWSGTDVIKVSVTTAPTVSAPSNDSCSTAKVLDFVNNPPTPNSFGWYTDTVDLNLASIDLPTESCNNDGKDVFYKVIIPPGKKLSVSADAEDTFFTVGASASCGAWLDENCVYKNPGNVSSWFDLVNNTSQPQTHYLVAKARVQTSYAPYSQPGIVKVSVQLN